MTSHLKTTSQTFSQTARTLETTGLTKGQKASMYILYIAPWFATKLWLVSCDYSAPLNSNYQFQKTSSTLLLIYFLWGESTTTLNKNLCFLFSPLICMFKSSYMIAVLMKPRGDLYLSFPKIYWYTIQHLYYLKNKQIQ